MAKGDNDLEQEEQCKLRASVVSRKEQRKKEQVSNKARKKAKGADMYATKGSAYEAKVIQAQASASFVKMKTREQKVSTATQVLGLKPDTLKEFGTPLCQQLMERAGRQLLRAMEDTPPNEKKVIDIDDESKSGTPDDAYDANSDDRKPAARTDTQESEVPTQLVSTQEATSQRNCTCRNLNRNCLEQVRIQNAQQQPTFFRLKMLLMIVSKFKKITTRMALHLKPHFHKSHLCHRYHPRRPTHLMIVLEHNPFSRQPKKRCKSIRE